MEQSMEEVLLEQLEDGETFLMNGEKLTVLENKGTRYVLCQRREEVIHIPADAVVEVD
jgi:hypothetical protein